MKAERIYEYEDRTDLVVDVEVDSLVAVLDELLVVPEGAIDENHRAVRLLQMQTQVDLRSVQN